MTREAKATQTVLHVASVSPSGSNRLALQYEYARGAWRNELLHLTATSPQSVATPGQTYKTITLPHRPRFRRDDWLPIRRFRSLIRRIFNAVALYWTLWRSKADVIHAHENSSLWPIVYWSSVLRRPAVWDPHDFFHEGARKRSRFGRANVKEFLERRLIKRRVPVLVVSNGMRALYREMYPDARIELLHSYSADRGDTDIDLDASALTIRRADLSQGKIRIVYPGLIKPGRIERSVFEAIGRQPKLEFDIFGIDPTGDYQREIEMLIERNQYLNIHFKGPFTPQGIRAILTDYHFALFPFPVTRVNIDICLPNKFFQCIEALLPMICTDMEEMGSIITQHGLGYVYPSQDSDALSATLSKCASDNESYTALLENMVEYRRSSINYAEQRSTLLEAYSAALESKGAPK